MALSSAGPFAVAEPAGFEAQSFVAASAVAGELSSVALFAEEPSSVAEPFAVAVMADSDVASLAAPFADQSPDEAMANIAAL